MSEENVNEASIEIEIPEAAPAEPEIEIVDDAGEAIEDSKPKGSSWVDPQKLAAADPDIKSRLTELYRQTKASDERNKVLSSHQEELEKALEFYASEVEKLKTTQVRSESAGTIANLNGLYKDALENSDFARAAQINEALLEVKLESKLAVSAPKAEKPKVERKIEQDAPSNFDPTEVQYFNRLATETDTQGAPLRPWLSKGHHDFEAAQIETLAIMNRGEYRGKPWNIIMDEVDKRMGVMKPQKPTQRSQADVLSGANLTNANSSPKLKIRQDEAVIARKLGITPTQYAKRKQLIAKGHRAASAEMESDVW